MLAVLATVGVLGFFLVRGVLETNDRNIDPSIARALASEGDSAAKASDARRDHAIGRAPDQGQPSHVTYGDGPPDETAVLDGGVIVPGSSDLTGAAPRDAELARLHAIVQQAYADLEQALRAGDPSVVARKRAVFEQANDAYRTRRRSLTR